MLVFRSLAAFCIPCTAIAAPAATIIIEPVRDNTLHEKGTGALSNGAGPVLFAGRTNQGSNFRRRGLLFFNTAAAVPAGSTITGVQLRLFCSQALSTSTTIALHPVTGTTNWGEGTSSTTQGTGAAATTGDATWLRTSFSTTAWSTAGGDFHSTPSASTAVSVEAQPYTWSGAGLVSDVQSWLDGPAGNRGWLLLGKETISASAKRFDSRENGTPANRPQLTVDYTPSASAAGWMAY